MHAQCREEVAISCTWTPSQKGGCMKGCTSERKTSMHKSTYTRREGRANMMGSMKQQIQRQTITPASHYIGRKRLSNDSKGSLPIVKSQQICRKAPFALTDLDCLPNIHAGTFPYNPTTKKRQSATENALFCGTHLKRLQDNYAGTFPHDKSTTVCVEGTASLCGVIVVLHARWL